MDNQPRSGPTIDDAEAFAETVADIAVRSQRLVSEFMERQARQGSGPTDPLNVSSAFMDMCAKMMANPAAMMQASVSLWQDHMGLWQKTAQRMIGQDVEPAAVPAKDDRRFRDPAWSENEVFNFIKQSYLLTSRWMQTTAGAVEGLDDKSAEKVDFYTRQFVNALSPSNFVMTNPEVLRATIESRGENLLKGLENLLTDLERGEGRLDINMTDDDVFEVGRNIAVTPGKIVLRTELLELIQYTPTTKTVRRRPLFIVTPWINKYYILDLRPENSFIKWAVDQGHTVFITSWVNPDASLADKSFDDYLLDGTLAGIGAICEITGQRDINLIGYCIGGTLTASTLAYMAATEDTRVKSATFFASMVDFEKPGELGVFIDEVQLDNLDESMNERGYLEGREMASTFNMMRDNDLIWSFVVNNYLLGRDPFPFDLLYWNSDSTRMPAAMHSFYLRQMYLENKLIEPGGISLNGVPIDLHKIDLPVYIMGTREDHIAPWKSAFAATQIYSGPIKFVLAASGHIAGIVNPPSPDSRYCHWVNSASATTPEAWLDGATECAGSWWPDWDKWVNKFAGGKKVPARQPGDGPLAALADAPGTYVKVRAI